MRPRTQFDEDIRSRYNWRHPFAWLRFQYYYRRAKWSNR